MLFPSHDHNEGKNKEQLLNKYWQYLITPIEAYELLEDENVNPAKIDLMILITIDCLKEIQEIFADRIKEKKQDICYSKDNIMWYTFVETSRTTYDFEQNKEYKTKKKELEYIKKKLENASRNNETIIDDDWRFRAAY